MSEDQLRRIFSEGEPGWLEQYSVNRLTVDEVVGLLDVPTFFKLLDLPAPQSNEAAVQRLVDERLADKVDGSYSIRRMGALLLARDLSAFPDVERKAARVVVYDGTSKLKTKLEQVGTKGYAVGFQGLVGFVGSQLPQNEVIEDALRREVKLVPDDVVRELVANALIHQDLTVGGTSVMIEVYDNRVEISNPGEPIVEVARFIDGYQSRNERMAGLMRRFRICEEKSSGIDRVVATVEAFQLPAPDFRGSGGRTIVTIFGHKPFDEMDRADRIRACYQHCALKYVMGETMTNQSLRARFGVPDSKNVVISQAIAAAVSEGLIMPDERVGSSRKFARYLPYWA
jgi:predicted HTH transcriptional regulator